MHWPPWRPDPDEVRRREEAERQRDEIRAKRREVEQAVETLQRHMIRNHLIDKAFAMREKGDR